MSGSLRPRVSRHGLVLLVLGAAFVGISRTTGAGWVVVLACGVTGALVVSAGWALLGAVGRFPVEVRAPTDAMVGRPLPVELRVRGRRGLQVRMTLPPGEWVAAFPPTTGVALVTPDRRGVLEDVVVELISGAPLGLLAWRRRGRVRLLAPLEVAPCPVETPFVPAATAREAEGETVTGGRVGGDAVRSVREYVPGDALRLVHWPSTARRGALIVKELENPGLPALMVVVDLRGDPHAAELTAGRAAGLAEAALAAGVPVELRTCERRGPVAGAVRSPLEAGRRLARAVAGPPFVGEADGDDVGGAIVRLGPDPR